MGEARNGVGRRLAVRWERHLDLHDGFVSLACPAGLRGDPADHRVPDHDRLGGRGQTATTNEINRSVAEAASGSSQIAAKIGDVATVARNTTALVHRTEQTVGELSQVTGELRTLVSRFRF